MKKIGLIIGNTKVVKVSKITLGGKRLNKVETENGVIHYLSDRDFEKQTKPIQVKVAKTIKQPKKIVTVYN